MTKPIRTLGYTPFTVDPTDDRSPQMQVPIALETDWMRDGACHATPQFTDFFFSYELGETDVAKSICVDCPVKSLCYAYALVYAERGVWGGTTQHERDERRPFIVEDVVELWPRLYRRWQGRTSEQGLVRAPVPARESVGVSNAPQVLSEAEGERWRARIRAGEGEWDNVRPFDIGPGMPRDDTPRPSVEAARPVI